MENEEKKKAKTIEEKLAALKEKTKQLQAQKQRQDARQRAKNSKEERARDTRKKILVGALVLAKVEKGESIPPHLPDLIKDLTRDDDRSLFGLPPLPS
jgi:glutamyl-tRNA reductase